MAQASIPSPPIGRPATTAQPPGLPSEGWLTMLLHLVIVMIMANTVTHVDAGERAAVLIPLALGGVLFGACVARTPALDALSHGASLLIGLTTAVVLFALEIDGAGMIWETRGRSLYELTRDIVRTQAEFGGPAPLDQLGGVVMIGATLWLVSYSSAWMLYRRHWLMPALVAPATLILVNLRTEDGEPGASLAVFAIAALVMIARHQAFIRQVEWNKVRIPVPRGVPARFTLSGGLIALLALYAGYALPLQSSSDYIDNLSTRAVSQWHDLAQFSQRMLGASPGGGSGSGGYASFGESFDIGGTFTPSEEPVASLQALAPAYLAARRYDVYTGRGWASGVDQTFRMAGDDSQVNATSVRFGDNQNVALSFEVNGNRDFNPGIITLYSDTNGLVFTVDTFVSASLPTVAVLGWRQLENRTIDVATVDIGALPIDLQSLVRALRDSEVTTDPTTGAPLVVDSAGRRLIDQLRERLRLYPVETALTFDGNGRVLLTVSGRLPNYDDIEAIFANGSALQGVSYRVLGTGSLAGRSQLQSAGTTYPDWVLQRYLQLPSTVTEGTVRLAAQIVRDAGAKTPFDQAWAVQQYLSATYPYAENSARTPRDRDAVDFFLFDKKIGRCEEYATSMVVMMRTLGVPARLVAGYRAGPETNAAGDYIYREKQAHTWVEVYFPNYGWIPFEPTQGQAPFDYGGAKSPADPPASGQGERQPTSAAGLAPDVVATPTAAPPVTAPVEESGGTPLGERLSVRLGIVSLLITGMAALTVLGFILAWIWSLRGLRPGAALFARTIKIGRFWGVDSHPTMTPLEYAARLGQAVPRARGAARHVADLYVAERYGGIEINEEARQLGRRAWRDVRAGLFSWRPWRRRQRRGR